MPARAPILSFKCRWEQHPSVRAAASAARSRRHLGLSNQATEAGNLLASVCGWFTEVFETLGLKEAKAPLEELAS